MMNGGAQNSGQQQSYNMGNSIQSSGAQTMQQSSQPFFMSQPNYGYQNPYAQIFANLSQQQQQLPQAPITQQPPAPLPNASPMAPVAPNPPAAPAAFDQSANNIAASLPATGQAPPAIPTPGAGAAPTPSTNPTSTSPSYAQFWSNPALSANYDRSSYTDAQRQNIYNKLYPATQ